MGGKAIAAPPVALSPRCSRVSRARGAAALLLGAAALAARLGGAGAACTCPAQPACTVDDLQPTLWSTQSCALDAAGHLAASVEVDRNDALSLIHI